MAIGIKRPPIFKIFCIQAIITVVISCIYYLASGKEAAYSAFLGGMIFVIPQLYFALKAFLYVGARSVDRIVVNFYKGESSKIVLIALGFGLVFVFIKPLDYLALYSSFIGLLFANCFSGLVKD